MIPPEPEPQQTLAGPAARVQREHDDLAWAAIQSQQAAVLERLENEPDNNELLQQLQRLHQALVKAQEAAHLELVPEPGIGDLPDEVLAMTLGLLTVTDVLRVALVCARWGELVRGQRVWCWLFLREQWRRAEPRSCPSGVPATMSGGHNADLASPADYGASCWRELYRDTFACRFDEPIRLATDSPQCSTKATVCKLLMVGDSGVGKTSFRQRFCGQQSFDFTRQAPTLTTEFQIRNARLRGVPVRVML
eukprot:COSAG06_NODE_14649_length_1138_cov_11244.659288_1_plen_249_part_10